MQRVSGRVATSIGLALAIASTIATACARDGRAQSTEGGVPLPSDSASVEWLLRSVRGADPLLCEFAVRSVDQHGSWNRDGLDGSPLESDSTAAAVVRWMQERPGDATVVPRLSAAMRDGDGCVRRIAASLLGRVDHASARTALVSALDDANAGTRQVAALGLGLGEIVDGEQPLIRRLRDDSALVRRAAAWALGQLERPTAEAALIELLQRDPDPRVRQVAAWAIGQSR
ncbi:MAG: HEAT repeat domain-containing protein [Gemmatimonadaceae bacterium]